MFLTPREVGPAFLGELFTGGGGGARGRGLVDEALAMLGVAAAVMPSASATGVDLAAGDVCTPARMAVSSN